MATNTPNLNLHVTPAQDTEKTVLDWRIELAGDSEDSNMMIIDSEIGSIKTGKADKTDVSNHIADTIKHISDEERTAWNSKASSTHNHDDRYYTESEIDNKFSLLGVQSDWSQNDINASDHVKNRPMYAVDDAEIFNQTLYFEEYPPGFIDQKYFKSDLSLVAGDVVTVTFNGISYQSEVLYEEIEDEENWFFGNFLKWGGEDTGEPYIFWLESNGMLQIDSYVSGNVEIIMRGKKVVQIDSIYIPKATEASIGGIRLSDIPIKINCSYSTFSKNSLTNGCGSLALGGLVNTRLVGSVVQASHPDYLISTDDTDVMNIADVGVFRVNYGEMFFAAEVTSCDTQKNPPHYSIRALDSYDFVDGQIHIGDTIYLTYMNLADGDESVAIGSFKLVSGSNQLVLGKSNIPDLNGEYNVIIGDGDWNTRSNSLTIDREGNAWYRGDVYIGGVNQFDGAKKLATEEYVGLMSAEDKIALNGKQEQLVSGVSIKTINGKSILGAGNLEITQSSQPYEYQPQQEFLTYNEAGDITKLEVKRIIDDVLTLVVEKTYDYVEGDISTETIKDYLLNKQVVKTFTYTSGNISSIDTVVSDLVI